MTKTLRCLMLGAVLAGAYRNGAAAEQESISTDRPDFLTGPDVVGRGRFQIELGALVQRDDQDNARTRTVTTPTLLRLGLTDALELRLDGDGRVRTRETLLAEQLTFREQGWADVTLGIKWNTHKANPETGAPSIGWVFQAAMPSGSREFRGRGVRPSVLGAFSFELANEMEFTINAGVRYDNDDSEGRFWSGVLGAGFSKGVSDRVTLLAEVAALQLARKRYGGSVISADFGVTYLLTRSVQLDALVGRGLTSDSPKYLFTTGIAAKF